MLREKILLVRGRVDGKPGLDKWPFNTLGVSNMDWSHVSVFLRFLLHSLSTKWAPFLSTYQKTYGAAGCGSSCLWSQTWRTEAEGLPSVWGYTRLQSEILSQHSHRENKINTNKEKVIFGLLQSEQETAQQWPCIYHTGCRKRSDYALDHSNMVEKNNTKPFRTTWQCPGTGLASFAFEALELAQFSEDQKIQIRTSQLP